ncbi:MAG: hypothetical protein ABSB19_19750, partial [Methylomonas sp.]
PGVDWAIESTPIIDPTTNTLYLVTRKTSPSTPYEHQLHALDLVSGAEKFGGPAVISATRSVGGATLTFNSQHIRAHAGLALVKGQLILTFAGLGEGIGDSYNGWVLAYNAGSLQQTGVFTSLITPPATGGGIWQSGRAPVIDDNGYIYLFVGNAFLPSTYQAASNGYDGVNNFSESLLKLDSGLRLIDWFTPGDWATLDNEDNDLSSAGPILIPGTHLLTGGGKDGNLFIWQTGNLGKYNADDAQVVQKMSPPVSDPQLVYSGPVFWTRNSGQGGSLLFNVYNSAPIYAYAFNGNTFNTQPVSISSASEAANTGNKNAIALSANGGEPGTGIIWELQNNPTGGSSVLRAFDAGNLGNELWNSQAYLSDSLDGATTYIPPTISNGKVYAPTLANQLVVFGLKTN